MLEIGRKIWERERESSNSGGKKKKKCNGETNFSSNFLINLFIIRVTMKENIYI